jgi:hypothetical protein
MQISDTQLPLLPAANTLYGRSKTNDKLIYPQPNVEHDNKDNGLIYTAENQLKALILMNLND